jgi:hypothetical protein
VCYVLLLVSGLIYRGYAGIPVNPQSTSVSFIPRGEMDGEPELKLLVNVSVKSIQLILG